MYFKNPNNLRHLVRNSIKKTKRQDLQPNTDDLSTSNGYISFNPIFDL